MRIQNTLDKIRTSQQLLIFPLFALLITSGFFVYHNVIPYGILGWDEASFELWGARVFFAIRSWDIREVVFLVRQQYIYPPLQSIFWGISLLPFGFTVLSARIANLFWFFSGGMLIYATAMLLPAQKRSVVNYAGIIAVLLYVLSPMVLVHAGLGLKEMMGVTLTLAFVYCYFRARNSPSFLWTWVTGFSVTLLVLTKYNYAAFAGLTLVIEVLINEVFFKRNDMIRKKHQIMLGVVAVGISIWVMLERSALLAYLSSQNEMTIGIGTFADRILFYPRSIIYLFAPLPIIGTALLTLFAMGLFFVRRYYHIRFMVILVFVTTVSMGTWTNNLHDRYIMTCIPFIFLIGAWMVQGWISKVKRKWSPIILVVLLIAPIVVTRVYLVPSFRSMVYGVGSYSLRIPIFNQMDFRDYWFQYDKSLWASADPWSSTENPNDVFLYIMNTINIEESYTLIGYTNAFSTKAIRLNSYLYSSATSAHTIKAPVVTVEVLPTSRYYTREYSMYSSQDLARIADMKRDSRYVMTNHRLFPELGFDVCVYVPVDPMHSTP